MPFCKFCKDSGKPQSVFTSHYPKDKPGKDGKVICPTILSNECRYCHEKGHAKSHCPKLKAKNSRSRMMSVHKHSNRRSQQRRPNSLNGWTMTAMKQQRPRFHTQPKRKEQRSISFNAFAALHEEDEVETGPIPVPTRVRQVTGCWSVKPDLSKEAVQKKLASKKQEMAVEQQDEVKDMVPLLTAKQAMEELKKSYKPSMMVNWGDAAMESSDEESEEEDDDEEIVLDSFGRPATDNSAW
tara:strand:- start:2388 stop:3107 length:720 start_codon:yes stop_codon:yes gene_type:complete